MGSLLAACGGGGGGASSDGTSGTAAQPLSGSATLQASAEVLVAASIQAQAAGAPSTGLSCALDSGSLPAGMTFASNCSLQGTPTQPGTYTAHITLTAQGFSGSIGVDASLRVAGPSLSVSPVPSSQLSQNTPVLNLPLVGLSFEPPFSPRNTDVYTYRLASGTLPAGMALDAATGLVSGTPTEAGSFALSIAATLVRNGASLELAPFATGIFVAAAPLDLRAEGAYEGTGIDHNRAIVLADGTLWLTYGTLEPAPFGAQLRFVPQGFLTGRAAPSGGAIPSFGVSDYSSNPPLSFNLSGNYETTQSGLLALRGFPSMTRPAPEDYSYDVASPLPGTTNSRIVIDSFEQTTATITFFPDGRIQGDVNQRCSFTGTHQAVAGKNVHTVQFDPFCLGGGSAPLVGIAYTRRYLFNGQILNQLLLMAAGGSGAAAHNIMLDASYP